MQNAERQRLPKPDLLRIAAEALVSHRTVCRWVAGQNVHENTQARIMQAINKLGITPTTQQDV